MTLKSMLAGGALMLGASLTLTAAQAAPVTLLDGLKGASAERSTIEKAAYGPCVWGRYRGWHRVGSYGTFRSCTPGAGWRYERRCWYGPGGKKYCRFN